MNITIIDTTMSPNEQYCSLRFLRVIVKIENIKIAAKIVAQLIVLEIYDSRLL